MISPTLLTLQVLVLSSPRSPRAKAWALTAGAAITLAVFAVVGATVLTAGGDTSNSGATKSVTYIIVRLVCGALLLYLGARALRGSRSPGERHQSRVQQRIASARSPFYLVVGVGGMLTDLSSLALFLPALHDITRSSEPDSVRLAAFAVLYLLTLAPLLLPVLLVTLLGHKSDAPLVKLNTFVTANAGRINAGICFVFAAYLLFTGISALINR